MSISQLSHAIRVLSAEAIHHAKSGHPGMPLGMAEVAAVLWQNHLQHNPNDPQWLNRDRFVLSNGHGSMLLYSLLYLTGYPMTIDDLKQFRQLHSHTPGHPELDRQRGIETTTGPLGQGLGHAVGMAIAEQHLRSHYPEVIDHRTYCFVGDGCLMEGLSHEVASLAGTLKLNRLIVFWDDNQISIDGQTTHWFAENTLARFDAYHWQTLAIDGHDPEAIDQAIRQAKQSDKPTLIACRTTLAHGAPRAAGMAKYHGAPLPESDLLALRQQAGWDQQPAFELPTAVLTACNQQAKGDQAQAAWQKQWQHFETNQPDRATRLTGQLNDHFTEEIKQNLAVWGESLKQQTQATRQASGQCIAQLSQQLPGLLGGSADLAESTQTHWQTATAFHTDHRGQFLHYGVREFGMFALMTGMRLHGGVLPFGGTFLVFSDYGKNAIRLAAMMKQRVIFVLTHDSIGLGEDGPTHQPVEHLAMLRAIPHLNVWRPADAYETIQGWLSALEFDGPTCLILSRQALPSLPHHSDTPQSVYAVHSPNDPELVIFATGSEVSLACAAAQQSPHRIKVLSCPAIQDWCHLSVAEQRALAPPTLPRLAIEAGHGMCWHHITPHTLTLEQFGVSAPGKQAMSHFGFTVDNVLKKIDTCLTLTHQGA